MADDNIKLVGRAIDGLAEAQSALIGLIGRGTLPQNWQDVEHVLDDCRNELYKLERILVHRDKIHDCLDNIP